MIGKVLVNLAERGIKPLMKSVESGTVLKYSLGGQKYVQLYDKAGQLSKFKIYHKGPVVLPPIITRGQRFVDEFRGITTTVKETKATGLWERFGAKPVKTVTTVDTLGSDMFKNITIAKTTGKGKEVTKISSSYHPALGNWGEIEKNGVVRKFENKPKFDNKLRFENEPTTDFLSLEPKKSYAEPFDLARNDAFAPVYDTFTPSYVDDFAINSFAAEQRAMEDITLGSMLFSLI